MKIIFSEILFDYEYVKNDYRLEEINLNTKVEVDVYLKAIQHTKVLRQLKTDNNKNINGTQSMFNFII